MPAPFSYFRIFTDQAGESHLDRGELMLTTTVFAPPAPPVDLSGMAPASSFALVRLPAGWHGEPHPTPSRQWLFFLSGTVNMTVSDGTSFEVRPGAAVLLEDTTGRGHQTTVIGDADVTVAAVQVPQS
jgi:mannose-6-phosphate isomerase-like protein (cupin superfamily)